MKRNSSPASGSAQWLAHGALAALVATSVVVGMGRAQAGDPDPPAPPPEGSASASASGSAAAPEPTPPPPPPASVTAPPAPPPAPPPAATASAAASVEPTASAAPGKDAATLAAEEASDRQTALIGGGVSLGVGVVGGVLFGVGYAQYKSALRDPVFDPYKNAYGGGADMCRLARNGDVPKGAVGFNVEDAQKKCDSADVFKTLGSAALPIGLVLVGMGTYLVAWGASGGEDEEPAATTGFVVTPYVGSDNGGLVAAGSF